MPRRSTRATRLSQFTEVKRCQIDDVRSFKWTMTEISRETASSKFSRQSTGDEERRNTELNAIRGSSSRRGNAEYGYSFVHRWLSASRKPWTCDVNRSSAKIRARMTKIVSKRIQLWKSDCDNVENYAALARKLASK